MNEVWAIILAAGKSTRMHRQKLLLPYKGKTIIEQVVVIAKKVVQHNVVVVLGSHSHEIYKQIKDTGVSVQQNVNYASGMLSSIVCGLNALPADAKAVLIFLGDQPHIPEKVPQDLIETWRTSSMGIILPVYKGKRGHPVLVETRFKTQINDLDSSKGLRLLMNRFDHEVFEVPCEVPEILRDIDTPADYFYELDQ